MNNNFLLKAIPLTLLLAISCSDRQDRSNQITKINDLSKVDSYELKGLEILQDEINVISLHVVDTLLIIELLEKKEWAYKVFSLNSRAFLGYLGKMGDGPNEFKRPRLSDQNVVDSTNTAIWINDPGKERFLLLDVLGSLNQPENKILFSKDYEESLGISQSLFAINKNEWVGSLGPDAEQFGRFLRKDLTNNTTEIIPVNYIVDNDHILNRQDLYGINFHHAAIKPDKGKVVSLSNHLSRVDIYKTQPKLKLENSGLVLGEKHNNLDGMTYMKNYREVTNYYMDVSVTDDKIYALYHGQPVVEYAKNIIPTQIRVFDWEGHLLSILNVPDYLITLTVDESKNSIYGVAFFEEKIMKYDFDLSSL